MAQLLEFLQNHWILSSLFVAFLVSYIVYELLVRRGGAAQVTPQKAVRLINQKGSTLFDVRPEDKFKQGHIIDAKQVNADNIVAACQKQKLKPDDTIILVCQAGISAGKCGAALKKAGFKQVYNITGGMNAWKQADLPTKAEK
jgi:rhodanese-related sulfurtransferase